MEFSNTTNRSGLIQDCEDITGKGATGISGTASVLQSFTRWINERYLEITGFIISCDGRWQWDDSNQTDLPIATTNLVSAQRDYTVIVGSPSTTQDWLEVEKVEVKDSNGDWYFINPIDKNNINQPLDEVYETDGSPVYYDFEGTSIKLYPATDYASTGGLKIYFKRAPLLFATDATTKKPGFASIFHKYLSLGASFDYCISNDMKRANNLKVLMAEIKADIKKFYSKRSKFEKPVLSRSYQSYK
jgi:hypothetical protein